MKRRRFATRKSVEVQMKGVANFNGVSRAGMVRNSQAAVDPVAQVVRETVAATVAHLGQRLKAIVLTGSAARSEATVLRLTNGWSFLGDCEFILVFQPREVLPESEKLSEIHTEIESRLLQLGIACPVGLSPVHPSYLARLGPQVYSFELKERGRVVWGDPNILTLIPACSADDIPREDAWRLVCNRMIEQLSVASNTPRPSPELTLRPDYRTVKLALDLATSLLLFCGEYAPSYQERSARLLKLAEKSFQIPGQPFALWPFAELVQRLTCWKICPASGEAETFASLQPTVWDYAARLWHWELYQLIGEPSELPDPNPMFHWMQLQPVRKRLQGWASLVRRCGLVKSFAQSPRWWRLGRRASPRYWIYSAAGELFFRLPYLMGDGEPALPNHSLETWRDWLPIRPREESGISWRQLARDINWNYQHFLMGTIS